MFVFKKLFKFLKRAVPLPLHMLSILIIFVNSVNACVFYFGIFSNKLNLLEVTSSNIELIVAVKSFIAQAPVLKIISVQDKESWHREFLLKGKVQYD
jgi:hypothetical protein